MHKSLVYWSGARQPLDPRVSQGAGGETATDRVSDLAAFTDTVLQRVAAAYGVDYPPPRLPGPPGRSFAADWIFLTWPVERVVLFALGRQPMSHRHLVRWIRLQRPRLLPEAIGIALIRLSRRGLVSCVEGRWLVRINGGVLCNPRR